MKISELLNEAPDNNPEVKHIKAKIAEWRDRIKVDTKRYVSTDIKPFGNFTIQPHEGGGYGIVHTSKELTLHEWMFDDNGELELKFISCNSLNIRAANVKSFKNFPDKILNYGNNFTYPAVLDAHYQIPNITSLEGISQYMNGFANFVNFSNLSFANAHKHISHVIRLRLPLKYNGPVLSLLKIPSLENVAGLANGYVKILNKHLAMKQRNILACQEELIDAGLKDYAEL